jgi:hypothetical protein
MSRFTTPEVATRQRATEGGSYMMTSGVIPARWRTRPSFPSSAPEDSAC